MTRSQQCAVVDAHTFSKPHGDALKITKETRRKNMNCDCRTYRFRRSNSDDPNAKVVVVGPITIWFSYVTPVAFRVEGRAKIVRRNDWSTTTGAHLNAIDGDHAKRIKGEDFMIQLRGAIDRLCFPQEISTETPPLILADWLEDRGLSDVAATIREKYKGT